MDKGKVLEFWKLYDEYVLTATAALRQQLSILLAEIETKSRETQLLRPEHGWNEILAWQVLRNQDFIFADNNIFTLHEGEIIAWTPHWDRDVFLTRNPQIQTVAGRFLKPGCNLSCEDQGETSNYEWNQIIRRNGLADERGLYLPLYTLDTLMKFCDIEIAQIRPQIIEYLKKEKFFNNPQILETV